MSDIRPYYQSFREWLGFVNPSILFLFVRGEMGVEEIKPYIREWAEDITSK